MTLTNPLHNWEEEEVENPVGSTAWVYNSLTNELTVLRTVETADEELGPWSSLRYYIKSAVLADGVASICDRTFYWCRMLKSIQIGRSVISIGDEAFAHCESLDLIINPDSVEAIGYHAFYKCEFTSIKIPRSVVSFDGNPFVKCWKLKTIDISENPNFVFEEGVMMDKYMTQIIHCIYSKSGNYSIPNTVTTICAEAFRECKLTLIVIPDSVKEIGDEAFACCYGMESITIPGSVETLGANLFAECSKLSEIRVTGEGENLKMVDGVLFYKEMTRLIWCSRKKSGSYEIPSTVKTIDSYAFNLCKELTSVTIPDSITEINDGVFCCCSGLETITIPHSITFIGDAAFCSCTSLESVVIPDSVVFIGDNAFSHCNSLESVVIPDSVELIGDWAFCQCSALTSVTFLSVTDIGEYAFMNCPNLKNFFIPSGLYYPRNAFTGSATIIKTQPLLCF